MEPTNVKKKELLTIQGTVGTDIWHGYLDVEYNPEWKVLQKRCDILDEMVDSDGTCTALIEAICGPLLSAKYFISEYENEEILEFVNKNLFYEMDFERFKREAYSMIKYGFSLFEKIYTIGEDGRIHLKELSPRLQRTIEKWTIEGKPWKDGHPAGVTQYVGNTDEDKDKDKGRTTFYREINWEKLVRFALKDSGNNFEGKSILRGGYAHWYYKQLLYRIGGISAERYGVGVPYTKVKQGTPEDELEDIKQLLSNIRSNEQAYAVFSSNVEEWGIMTPSGGGGQLTSMMEQINHHDRKLYDSILAGFLNLSTGDGGSNALSKDQSSFFLSTLNYVARYFCGVMDGVIKELIDINFGKQETYPYLTTTDIGNISLDEITNALSTAKAGGLLTWRPEDEVGYRETAGLNSITVEEIEKSMEEKEEMAQEIAGMGTKEVEKEEKEDDDMENKKKEKLSLSEEPPKPYLPQREKTFTKNISDFENELEGQWSLALAILEEAETRIQEGLLKYYDKASITIVDGVKKLDFVTTEGVRNNKALKKEMIKFVKNEAIKAEEKLVGSKFEERLFALTEKSVKKAIADNRSSLSLADIKISEAKFNSFIAGYISNVEALLFNDPRRVIENIEQNFGSGVAIELVREQVKRPVFNRNIAKLSIITHPRGAYNAVLYDAFVQDGFVFYKATAPKKVQKNLSPSGMTMALLFSILTASEINKKVSEKTDGANTSAIDGLNIHHNGQVYFYPVLTSELEAEKELAQKQKSWLLWFLLAATVATNEEENIDEEK